MLIYSIIISNHILPLLQSKSVKINKEDQQISLRQDNKRKTFLKSSSTGLDRISQTVFINAPSN